MVNQTIRLIDKSELENVLLSQLTLSPRVTRTVKKAFRLGNMKRPFWSCLEKFLPCQGWLYVWMSPI
ncbi:Polyphosphate:AMP phosphotransferase [Trichinella pseudospiralis]